MLCHNVDVMHIKRKCVEDLIYTLLSKIRRIKDYLNAQRNLYAMGIRKDLWPNDKGKY